ncbi:hypothetical protein BD311DRAFT_804924 [Dichomitus squalens]|uniref:Cyclin N-terminal domain-containing protein n=1 Tax=Dichomitus squalens TaxID=114155 RepID=A0A4Q9MTC8_9APHY|nr:hypothetical protein BD311DRAFT_804924 [Dichomitus squalens]
MASLHWQAPHLSSQHTRQAPGSSHPHATKLQHRVAPALPVEQPPYYGQEELARLSTNFLRGLFACPDLHEPSQAEPAIPFQSLKHFIAYVLYRTRFDSAVVFSTLYLLYRLKERYPACTGTSGLRLFLPALVVTAKMMLDDTYSNKSFALLSQGMFPVREVNHMERKLLSEMDMEVNPPTTELFHVFKAHVRERYSNHPKPWEKIHFPTRNLSTASGYTHSAYPYPAPSHSTYPYPVPSHRATDPVAQPPPPLSSVCHSSPSQPPLRLYTTFPTSPFAAYIPEQIRPYRDTPHASYTSLQPLYDSPESSPSPITPDDYRVHDAGYSRKAIETQVSRDMPTDAQFSMQLPGDAYFGSVAPRRSRRTLAA